MRYDIYFHNDFDGRASAAIMLAFLRSRGDDIAHYYGMEHGDVKKWYAKKLAKRRNPAIVVDYLYHPETDWWFDHHATTFKKPGLQEKFVPDAQHHLESEYASCCHLVCDALKKEFGWKPPKHFAELVRWLDIIDGAQYRSARETVDMKEPAIKMNAYVEALRHSPRENEHMIKLLASHPLAEVIKDRSIARPLKTLEKKVAQSTAYYKKNLQVFKRTTFIELTHDPLNGLLRYLPYYLQPTKVYGIRMRWNGKFWHLGVGVNPWRRRQNKFDFGPLMRKYGGGGHKTVGATQFRTRTAALAAFREINALLNK